MGPNNMDTGRSCKEQGIILRQELRQGSVDLCRPIMPRRLGTVICVLTALVFLTSLVKAEETSQDCQTRPADQPCDTQPADTVRESDRPDWLAYCPSKGGFQLYNSEDGQANLSLGGEVLMRYAQWKWFEGPSEDNEYDYGFQRTRLNLKYTSPHLTAFLQPQYVHMFGVPNDAFKKPPEGPLGMGGLYYVHNHRTDPYDIGIHQGYVALRSAAKNAFSLKLGRFEYSDGLEVLQQSDGKHFNALKKMRLADRMISPFGWSAFSRSFDGVVGQHDRTNLNVTASFFYPTQGGWEQDIDTTIDDIRITTLTVTGKRGFLIPGMELAGFYYDYRDIRDVDQRVDNTPPPVAPGAVDIDIHMIGGHAIGTYDIGPGTMDVLLWGGVQLGDWYELDQEAYAFAAEAGYQFTNVFAKPWLRMGYYIGSGDDNPGDGDHETFFQMAPGTRKYNLLPYCDLMNNEDLFVQLITHPLKNLMLRMDYHILRLNEEDDRWYMGSGPTQRRGHIFGYLGRPSSGESDLAQELDFLLNYEINPHCSVMGSYSHIFGGDVVRGVYGDDDEDADYVSVEVRFTF